MTKQVNKAFSAQDIFDPKSDYNRMRSFFKEELKLRGLFYELKAAREAQPQPGLAPGLAADDLAADDLAAAALETTDRCELVWLASDPGREVDAKIVDRFISDDETTRLWIRIRLLDQAAHRARKARCRVFLLTAGMIEQICGPNALQSRDWTRSALRHLFEGKSQGEAREIARVLSAVPELSGTIDSAGECELSFDLPAQAGDFDSMPEVRAIVVVIDRARGDASP
jgi:hypothetical protein